MNNKFLDPEQVNQIINITNYYKKEEGVLTSKLKNSFNSIKYTYISDNSEKITNIMDSISNKTNKLLKKSSEDIYILQKALETYNTAKDITKSIFENIN